MRITASVGTAKNTIVIGEADHVCLWPLARLGEIPRRGFHVVLSPRARDLLDGAT